MKYLLKTISTILLLNCCTMSSFCATTYQQSLITTIPAAVNISAYNQSLSKGTINPQTGVSSSPSASFNIKTNGEDCNYTYTMQAKVLTSGNGDANAYFRNSNRDYIILGNVSGSHLPSLSAVNNIKSSTPVASNNANVIAYPITNTLANIQSANMTNNQLCQGLCYVIRMGNSQNGNIVQTLGSAPYANTYSISNDRAGTYQAVITISANRNP